MAVSSIAVQPLTDTVLSVKLAEGLLATVTWPAGSVQQPTTVFYDALPLPLIRETALRVVGGVLELTINHDDGPRNGVFLRPFTITLVYSEDAIAGLQEEQLSLYARDDGMSRWLDAGIALQERNTMDNRLVASATHLGQFGLAASAFVSQPVLGNRIFLPIVVK